MFIVWVQKTRSYIANDAVLYVNYASMLSFAPAISFAAEPQVCRLRSKMHVRLFGPCRHCHDRVSACAGLGVCFPI